MIVEENSTNEVTAQRKEAINKCNAHHPVKLVWTVNWGLRAKGSKGMFSFNILKFQKKKNTGSPNEVGSNGELSWMLLQGKYNG